MGVGGDFIIEAEVTKEVTTLTTSIEETISEAGTGKSQRNGCECNHRGTWRGANGRGGNSNRSFHSATTASSEQNHQANAFVTEVNIFFDKGL